MNNDLDFSKKKQLIEQLSDSSTALVCNALDFLGIEVPYMDETVRFMTPGLPPLVGEVVTIKLDSSTPGNKADTELYYRMLEEMSKRDIPKVVVVQTVGIDRHRECVAGDGMAKTFLSVGTLGLVTDGGIRDIKDIINQGFKVFGLGHVVQHTPLVWSGLYQPVQLGGITVRTGDILHGDMDGVIVVPKECWGGIVRACSLTMDFEKKAHVVLRQSGIPISEKREKVTQFWHDTVNKIKDNGAEKV